MGCSPPQGHKKGLAGNRMALIELTLGLFMLSIFLFLRLYQALYMPEIIKEKSEREVFEGFSIQHDLSTQEREVLWLVLAEQPNAQIAEALFVSESTIKYHVHTLLQKTGCRSRQELVKNITCSCIPVCRKRNNSRHLLQYVFALIS